MPPQYKSTTAAPTICHASHGFVSPAGAREAQSAYDATERFKASLILRRHIWREPMPPSANLMLTRRSERAVYGPMPVLPPQRCHLDRAAIRVAQMEPETRQFCRRLSMGQPFGGPHVRLR